MVSTRQQTGKLPQHQPRQSAVEEGHGVDIDRGGFEGESDDDRFGVENDELDSSSKQRGKRPAKRAKTTHRAVKAQTKSVARGRRKKDLSLLITMPLDIVFEVVAHLTPKDLLNLSRTNHEFRAFFISPSLLPVWKAARDRMGAPDCPEGVSDMLWTSLLFGGTKCQECGTSGVHQVEFLLLRRVCVACKKRNYVVNSKFVTVFPGVDPSILPYLLSTTVGGWSQGHVRKRNYYWKADIEAFLAKVEAVKHDAKSKNVDVTDHLNEFYESRTKLVENISKRAALCDRWVTSQMQDRQMAGTTRCNQRREQISAKLREMGYSQADVDLLQHHSLVDQDKELTDRIWKRIGPILQIELVKAKADHLKYLRDTQIRERSDMAKEVYATYKKGLKPDQWIYLPPFWDVYHWAPFLNLIEGGDDNFTSASFDDAANDLPTFVADWTQQKKASLRQMLKDAEEEIEANGSSSTVTDPKSTVGPSISKGKNKAHEDEVDTLDLASSIFHCEAHHGPMNTANWGINWRKIYVGWEGAVSHISSFHVHYYSFESSDLQASATGIAAAKHVIRLAGLDPSTATPAQMDELGLYFMCANCEPKDYYFGAYGKEGMKWRTTIGHQMSCLHPKIELEIIDAGDAANLRHFDEPGFDWQQVIWMCNHCASFYEAPKWRSTVVEHLDNIHGITEPKEGDDLFIFPGAVHKWEGFWVYGMERPSKECWDGLLPNDGEL